MATINDTAARAILSRALATPQDKLDTVLVFDGRDSYVAFVALWKVEYAAVVARIKAEKAIRRDKANSIPERNAAQNERQSLRHVARDHLDVRVAGKAVARAARAERLKDAA